MPIRNILVSALALGAAACVASLTTAAELPKEGTCRYKAISEGKEVFSRIDYAQYDGAGAWDEERAAIPTCDQWPPMTEHCFGLDEIIKGAATSQGYCVQMDAEGDGIIWKVLPHAVKAGTTNRLTSELLMSSGKYRDMKGHRPGHLAVLV